MPLYLFYTMVQKWQKWPKTQIKGGPALNGYRDMLFPRVERWWDVRFNFLHDGAGAWFM